MTDIKKALEELTNRKFYGYVQLTVESVETIKKALKKQIPKKPKITLHNGYCGNCGEAWGYDRLKTEEYCGFKYFQYCPICGQAIDWSEEE